MQYKAFMSYSHAADGKLAPALQSALQRFAKKWYQLRAFRVFRDDASLATTPALWKEIQRALDNSEFFILMASPKSAVSVWVQREVDHWLKNHSVNNLLIVLTEGELLWDKKVNEFVWNEHTPLPVCLKGVFKEEPRYLDLRWARNPEKQLSLNHNRFRESVADLGATLHDRPKDDLIGEEVRQHRKFRRSAWSGVIALFIFAVGMAIAAYWALQQTEIAERRQLEAETAAKAERKARAEADKQREEADRQRAEAERQKTEAEKQRDVASRNEKLAEQRRLEAERQKNEAERQKQLATKNEKEARRQSVRVAASGIQTAAFAQVNEDPTLGALLLTNLSQLQVPYGGLRTAHELAIRPLAISSLAGHTNEVSSAAYSPDGQFIVTASNDATARVWRADGTGEPVVLKGPSRLCVVTPPIVLMASSS